MAVLFVVTVLGETSSQSSKHAFRVDECREVSPREGGGSWVKIGPGSNEVAVKETIDQIVALVNAPSR